MEDSLVWRESGIRARNLARVPSVEEAVGKQGPVGAWERAEQERHLVWPPTQESVVGPSQEKTAGRIPRRDPHTLPLAMAVSVHGSPFKAPEQTTREAPGPEGL